MSAANPIPIYNSLSDYFFDQLISLEQDYQAPAIEEQIIRAAINTGFIGNALLGIIEGCFRMFLAIPAHVIDVAFSFTDSDVAPNFSALIEAQATSFYLKYQFYVLNQFLLVGGALSFIAVKASLDHVGNNFKEFCCGKNVNQPPTQISPLSEQKPHLY
jgi:hypothetical protein